MKAVLMSIQPKWCELIANEEKTIEVRKTKPKIGASLPFKCYIYCTQAKPTLALVSIPICINHLIKAEYEDPDYYNQNTVFKANGKVIGEFICRWIEPFCEENIYIGLDEISNARIERLSCIELDEILKYKGNEDFIYGWHISDLIIYDKPKELREFRKTGALSYDDWLYGLYNGTTQSTYENYLKPFRITRPPQSWCYVEELIK